jgi:hypothetical protein
VPSPAPRTQEEQLETERSLENIEEQDLTGGCGLPLHYSEDRLGFDGNQWE